MDGKVVNVSTTFDFSPGQTLKLKVINQTGGRWLFQIIGPSGAPAPQEPRPDREVGALALAFLSRGLPAAEERLHQWSRWMSREGGPQDRDTWAASLEARGEGPFGVLSDEIEPWLAWQAALEVGQNPDPPEDDRCWDQWNLRKTPDGAPWLVMPLRWEYFGQADAGLLQAHWNPQGMFIDRWVLTAAPATTPFRLEARVQPGQLDLNWRFFHPGQRVAWESWVNSPWFPRLSSPDLAVNLTVSGLDPKPLGPPQEGVDVQA